MCNPAEFYPFAKYPITILLMECIVPTITISLGIFAYFNLEKKKKDKLKLSGMFKLLYLLAIFGAMLGVNIVYDRIPRIYAFYSLNKNYKVTKTEIINVNKNPKGIHFGKYLIKHKSIINNKIEFFETSDYNKDAISKLNSNKPGDQYWLYYNPENIKTYLVDFRNTTTEIQPVCN